MKKIVVSLIGVSVVLLLIHNYSAAQAMTRPQISLQEQNTMAVLWFQRAGEAKALYYQGYNMGKMRLEEILRDRKKTGKKLAVVLDLDETVLDNSPFFAWLVQSGTWEPQDWSKWFNRAEAKPLPGALEFLHFADKNGVAIYYISNRKEAQKEATIRNLKAINVPQAVNSHVLLQQENEVGKEKRRLQVAKTHDIVLFFGDNLGDFKGFDELSSSGRVQAVERVKDEFGKRFIMFPNPMYGDWEASIYQYDFKKSKEEIAKQRKQNLQPYRP